MKMNLEPWTERNAECLCANVNKNNFRKFYLKIFFSLFSSLQTLEATTPLSTVDQKVALSSLQLLWTLSQSSHETWSIAAVPSLPGCSKNGPFVSHSLQGLPNYILFGNL